MLNEISQSNEFPTEVVKQPLEPVAFCRRLRSLSRLTVFNWDGKALLTELELFGQRLVPARIGGVQVIQQTATLPNHFEQATAGAVTLVILLQVSVNWLIRCVNKAIFWTKFRRTGITLVHPKFFNHLRFSIDKFHLLIQLS